MCIVSARIGVAAESGERRRRRRRGQFSRAVTRMGSSPVLLCWMRRWRSGGREMGQYENVVPSASSFGLGLCGDRPKNYIRVE